MIILETARLVLREFVPEDADALARILSDPETMRYYPAPYDRAGVEQWIARHRERYKNDGAGLWAMELKAKAQQVAARTSVSHPDGPEPDVPGVPLSGPQELIGDCGVIRQEVDGESLYEIGYHLRRDYWGQGLATEAARACRDWAFAHMKTDRLISLIRPENMPSRRVAERNGMTVWKEANWRGLQHYVYSIEQNSPRPNHVA
jgi:[ribosomal protein S5]-alanine N-acetyltransferase